MNATCLPLSIACSAASAATTVLPLPTSPCSSRCIGIARARSCAISRHDALLRARELERQPLEQRARQRAGAGAARGARRADARLAMRLQRQLLREQLVELEPRPRRMRALVERLLRERRQSRRRRVQEARRRRRIPTAAPAHESSGSVSAEPRRVGCERALDQLAQRVLRQARRRRIDRRQPIGQRRVGGDDAELRMHDLQTEVPVADVAEHAHARAGSSAFCWLG